MSWDQQNLAHRYTQSFFISEYQDSRDTVSNDECKLEHLNYFNIAATGVANRLSVLTAASSLIRYFVKNGIEFHTIDGVDDPAEALYDELIDMLEVHDKLLLDVANKMDQYFKFFYEQ